MLLIPKVSILSEQIYFIHTMTNEKIYKQMYSNHGEEFTVLSHTPVPNLRDDVSEPLNFNLTLSRPKGVALSADSEKKIFKIFIATLLSQLEW